MAATTDMPRQQRIPCLYLSTHVDDAETCAVRLSDAFAEELVRTEDAAIQQAGASRSWGRRRTVADRDGATPYARFISCARWMR